MILDRSDVKDPRVSKTYGFTSDTFPANATARYDKVRVLRADPPNKLKNDGFPPCVHEVKVFGNLR